MDVKDPWADDVPISEWTATDFASRNGVETIYGGEDTEAYLIPALADYWRCNHGEAVDRAVRIYIGHLLDTNPQQPTLSDDSRPVIDVREGADVHVLAPPKGWVEDSEYPLDPSMIGPVTGDCSPAYSDTPYSFSIPEVVLDIVTLVASSGDYQFESNSQLFRVAVAWVCGREADIV